MLDASEVAGATGDAVDNPEQQNQFGFVLSQFAQKKPTGGLHQYTANIIHCFKLAMGFFYYLDLDLS